MKSPKFLADQMQNLRDARKVTGADGLIRETFTLALGDARTKAREILNAYPSGGYMTVIENWRQLPDGRIEFTSDGCRRRIDMSRSIYNVVKAPMGWSVSCDGVRIGGILGTKEIALETAAVAAAFLVRDGNGVQINVPADAATEEGWPKRWEDLLK